ncbi:MAG: hypothetical protein L3J82_01255 [Planctomycetes bacterium]|nr:hypothetical protein [Planctomycetota bacterium]
MNKRFSLIGCYRVPESCFGDDIRPSSQDEWPWFVIVILPEPFAEVDFGAFTQSIEDVDESNWQVAKDEMQLQDEYSAGFFFHCIDWNAPLVTPYGEFNLPLPAPMPVEYMGKVIYYWD